MFQATLIDTLQAACSGLSPVFLAAGACLVLVVLSSILTAHMGRRS